MPSKRSGGAVKVVLDTNVLVSATINKAGASYRLFNLLRSGKLTLVTSPFQLRELMKVLHYQRIKKKYRLSEMSIKKIVRSVRKYSVLVFPDVVPTVITADRDDDQILAAASEGKPDAIVSGDEHLLKLKKYRSIPIYLPKQFLQNLTDVPGGISGSS